MIGVLEALLVVLVVGLFILGVLWIAGMILDRVGASPQVKQIVYAIIGVVGLILLLTVMVYQFRAGGPPVRLL